MKTILSATLLTLLLAACNSSESASIKSVNEKNAVALNKEEGANDPGKGLWKGTFSNGMKGATISFEVEGNTLKDLTFQGYWRCDGKLEQTTIGPDGTYTIKGKTVEGIIKESGFYFELQGTFNGAKASGTLRFAFVAGACDTYKLNWTAEKQ
ncbi:MAG TPA: hypothetical protein VGB71_00115 [Flavisolibacter sp.]